MKTIDSIYIVRVNGLAVKFVSNACGRFVLDAVTDDEAQRFPDEQAAQLMAAAYQLRPGTYEICKYQPRIPTKEST